jgi:hypothetical protein
MNHTNDPNYFPAGTYVVLLQACTGTDFWETIPANHVYKLREDSSTFCFRIHKDIRGSSSNGWSTKDSKDCNNKLKLRKATNEEILAYDLIDGPVPALQPINSPINDTYEPY